jgi:hypothetical protein
VVRILDFDVVFDLIVDVVIDLVFDLIDDLFIADIWGQYKQEYNNVPLEFGIRDSSGIK